MEVYIPPVVEDYEQVFYWEWYRDDFILIARYKRRKYIPDKDKRNPADDGYWCGYLGHKTQKDLCDYISVHRGCREWLQAADIPKLGYTGPLFGFSGQNFNDRNIRPDETLGYFKFTGTSPVIELDMDYVFEILRKAVDKQIENPMLLPPVEAVYRILGLVPKPEDLEKMRKNVTFK